MNIKNLVQKAIGTYLLFDGGVDVVAGVGDQINQHKDNPTAMLAGSLNSIKYNKANVVKAGVGGALIGIDFTKPLKKALGQAPVRRAKKRTYRRRRKK